MKLFITGGAGFIGCNFIRHITAKYKDYQIINYDALTYAGSIKNTQDFHSNPNYSFVHGDILDKRMLRKALSRGADAIINFAAQTHVDRSITSPEQFIKTNMEGTLVLLEAALELKVGKFVQISTDEVYGSLGESGKFTEDSPLLPNSPYSASKAGADLLVRSYNQTYGLPVNIVRSSNNYGPHQYPEKLIPLMIFKALADEPLPVYGDGQQVRDWLHVKDNCRAIDVVLHKGMNGQVYNAGGSKEKTNLDVVRLILSCLGKSERLISFVQDRPGHDRRYALDCFKIRNELGWRQEQVSFEEGLAETVEWYLNNRDWW